MSSTLAINGGNPVRKTMLNYATQSISKDDRKAVEKVLQGDWLTTGPAVAEFEKSLRHFVGAGYAVAVNTGTAALHAAANAVGIGPGDEVIVPAISFVASANCILYQGGIPVFVDLSSETLNIDPADIERKITPKTRAIVAVDFAGHPCDHDSLRQLGTHYRIPVIEDAAHALGAIYKGQNVGTLHPLSTFSFHPVKHITTGEGGAVLTDDDLLAKNMQSFRHHGIDLDLHARGQRNSWEYDVVKLGYNYRIPDINCALGISQIKKLGGWLERRRSIASAYAKGLGACHMLQLPEELPDCKSAWHLYVVRLNLDTISVTRAEIFSALRAENIGVNVHYIPIPWMTHYANLGYQRGQWPVAENEYERVLSLPMYPGMNNCDVSDVIEAIEKIWNNYRR